MNKEIYNLGVGMKFICLVKVSCFLGILLGKTYSIDCKRQFSIVAESNIWPVKSWSPKSHIHEQNHQCAVNMKWNAFRILHWASVDINTYYNTEPNPNIPKLIIFVPGILHSWLIHLRTPTQTHAWSQWLLNSSVIAACIWPKSASVITVKPQSAKALWGF